MRYVKHHDTHSVEASVGTLDNSVAVSSQVLDQSSLMLSVMIITLLYEFPCFKTFFMQSV